MRKAITVVALLLGLGALACLALAVLAPGGRSASASAGLACSVKASCGGGEVAVFRMSATSNAHAGTTAGSSYGNVVCCGGVVGLSNSCGGVHETVLTLSGTGNAHVASDASYGTEACLSVGAGTVDCTYGSTCGGASVCLATISSSTNAHVADCDPSNDYTTKVCCAVTGGAVGGIAELPEVAQAPASRAGSSGSPYAAIAGGLAAALALTAGAWYARRRWGR